jgi:hypothetical protein
LEKLDVLDDEKLKFNHKINGLKSEINEKELFV